MGDLISKEDALMQARPEYLNPQQKRLASYNQGWNDALDEYVDRIKEIPSAGTAVTVPNGWILCSESLPKSSDWAIVTILDENGDTPYRYTDFGWYLEAAKCWVVGSEPRTDVTAWMSLPKPYREGEN